MTIMSRLLGRSSPAPRVEPQVSAAQETSGVTSPESWMNDIGFAGGQSRVKSLPRVSPISAQRHATVFACCSILAGDLSKVPLYVVERDRRGNDTRLPDHPLHYLLNTEAAPGISGTMLRFAMVYGFALRGEVGGYAPRDGAGEVTLIDVLQQDRFSVLEQGRDRIYQFEDGAKVFRRVPSRSMVHLRYMALDGWTARSPIQVAAESIGLALAGQEAAAESASGSQLRGYIKLSDDFEDDDARMRSAKRVAMAIRDPELNGIPVLGQNDEIGSLDMSAADRQLLESREFDREQIAAIYRMPPSKLQILRHGVKANGQQQAIDYRQDCLLHWEKLFSAQMALGLLTQAERRRGLTLAHDFDVLAAATTLERIEAGTKAVGGPIYTPNEWRRREGMEDAEGGDRLNPAPNMTRDDAKPNKDDET